MSYPPLPPPPPPKQYYQFLPRSNQDSSNFMWRCPSPPSPLDFKSCFSKQHCQFSLRSRRDFSNFILGCPPLPSHTYFFIIIVNLNLQNLYKNIATQVLKLDGIVKLDCTVAQISMETGVVGRVLQINQSTKGFKVANIACLRPISDCKAYEYPKS